LPGAPEEIPDYQSLMLPVLKVAKDGEVRIGAVVELLADSYALSSQQRAHLLPSGKQSTFANRVHWAKSYLSQAGLVEATKRGHFRATPRGIELLLNPPPKINIAFLRQFPEFQNFFSKYSKGSSPEVVQDENPSLTLTPDEDMRRAHSQIERDLAEEMLSKILAASPAFFEQVVVNLVTAMGYGGSVADAGQALGQSGDGGVDGVINEDTLGLDRIYVQAKRYKQDNVVGPGAIRDFFGALDQFKAGKGLFVTTSSFSSSAVKTADGLSKRIVLVDGPRLTKLMIQYNVGCRIEETMAIKRIDEDFFEY
jgi:restriction system protein